MPCALPVECWREDEERWLSPPKAGSLKGARRGSRGPGVRGGSVLRQSHNQSSCLTQHNRANSWQRFGGPRGVVGTIGVRVASLETRGGIWGVDEARDMRASRRVLFAMLRAVSVLAMLTSAPGSPKRQTDDRQVCLLRFPRSILLSSKTKDLTIDSGQIETLSGGNHAVEHGRRRQFSLR